MRCIVQLQCLCFLAQKRNTAPCADLPPTGDARLHAQQQFFIRAIGIRLAGHHRPRADKAHIPLQDRQKLRQLIYACLTEKFPQLCDARVFIQFAVDFIFHYLLWCKPALQIIRIHYHRSEFVHLVRISICTFANAHVDCRPPIAQFNGKCDKKQERR